MILYHPKQSENVYKLRTEGDYQTQWEEMLSRVDDPGFWYGDLSMLVEFPNENGEFYHEHIHVTRLEAADLPASGQVGELLITAQNIIRHDAAFEDLQLISRKFSK